MRGGDADVLWKAAASAAACHAGKVGELL